MGMGGLIRNAYIAQECSCKRSESCPPKDVFQVCEISLKPLGTAHRYDKISLILLNQLIYKNRAPNFPSRKLELNVIYNTYLNESSFKYYISISGGGGGSEAMLILLIRGLGGLELGKTCLYNTCTLPYSNIYSSKT